MYEVEDRTKASRDGRSSPYSDRTNPLNNTSFNIGNGLYRMFTPVPNKNHFPVTIRESRGASTVHSPAEPLTCNHKEPHRGKRIVAKHHLFQTGVI